MWHDFSDKNSYSECELFHYIGNLVTSNKESATIGN